MRVAFDSRAQSDPRGIGRYVRCLLRALQATTPDDASITETHRPRRSDVFHSPWLDGAQLRSPCPSVVTLHDLVALKRRSEYLRTGVRFGLRYLAVQHAEQVIVPSHAVASDAQELLSIDPTRITVVPEAADAVMYPRSAAEVARVRKQYGLPEQYLLWVGSLQHPEPRKRVAALAQAPRELPLVLAGPAREWAYELPDVPLTGQVDDDDLAAIYSGAHALVVPSEDEGWGHHGPPRSALLRFGGPDHELGHAAGDAVESKAPLLVAGHGQRGLAGGPVQGGAASHRRVPFHPSSGRSGS